jgi:hypothetical protein
MLRTLKHSEARPARRASWFLWPAAALLAVLVSVAGVVGWCTLSTKPVRLGTYLVVGPRRSQRPYDGVVAWGPRQGIDWFYGKECVRIGPYVIYKEMLLTGYAGPLY